MKKDVLKVGTLISDNGRMAIISKVIEVGELQPALAYISWRANYEIMYTDGSKLVIGCRALEQMITNGVIIIHKSAAELPPSSSVEDTEACLLEWEGTTGEEETK
tara:strand:+ start:4741 stop:5055 length:315 start_codon:yes stop_codon:yes gene_type:complete